MEWISRVVRGAGGRLQVRVARRTGDETVEALADLSLALPSGGERRNAFIALPHLTQQSPRRHLHTLGLPPGAAAGQPVYETAVHGKTWSIPAQLLVTMTLCTRRQLRERLLTPYPLHELAHELLTPTICEAPLAARLNWLLDSPSAFRAWASVYRNALDGRFDMALPDASIEFLARGIEVDGVFYVTHGRLLSLSAHDSLLSTPVAANTASCSAHLTVNGANDLETATGPVGASFRAYQHVHHDHRLSHWTASSKLTDAQWEGIRLRVDPRDGKPRQGHERRHDLRAATETVLLKLANGTKWADVVGERRVVAAAANLYQRLRRSGSLDEVVAAVAPKQVDALT